MTANDLRRLRNELRTALVAQVDQLYVDEMAAISAGEVGLARRLHAKRGGTSEAYQTVWTICQAQIDALAAGCEPPRASG